MFSEASNAVCSVRAQEDTVPGEVCITLNQTQELVANPVGSWSLLPGRVMHAVYLWVKLPVCV